jgi:hypothetical protein
MATKPTPKAPAKAPRAKAETAAPADTPAEGAEPPAGAAAKTAEVLKMKAFLARVVEASGGKRKGVKEAVEATLGTLAAVIGGGGAFNLPPLGKGRIVKSADGVVTVKLRAPAARKKVAEKEPLAEAGE